MFAVRWASSLPDRREPTPDRGGTLLKVNRASRLLIAEQVEQELVKNVKELTEAKKKYQDR